MNFKVNESTRKLQGSYYTPNWIADFVARWISSYKPTLILEPSCGDGVFFQALSAYTSNQTTILGFDTDSTAIEACQRRALSSNIDLSVNCEDFLNWAVNRFKKENQSCFDAIVGNPPFIRYQYLEKDMQEAAQDLFKVMGQKFTKHTNAWLPFLLASIAFLKPGGHIGMIIPSEILHVLYAQGIREYLIAECSRILLIDPEDLWFDDTLQGASLLMAEKKGNSSIDAQLGIIRTIGRSFTDGDPRAFFDNADYLPASYFTRKWTYALLTKSELEAFNRIKASNYVFLFSELADVDVGIVTGANKYFLVPDETVNRYQLHDIAHPMFGRSEHCRGIIYDMDQHKQNAANGFPTNFLYFETEEQGEAHRDYLAIGEEQSIPTRYKCRIRTPWFKVPSVYSSRVNMLKRSNGMPRLILNEIDAYNTDTAYRITPKENVSPDSLVYCFINTITALSAELEGRFYGGGVLELVPSEIERLLTVYVDKKWDIRQLNADIKEMGKEDLLRKQDEIVFSSIKDIATEDILILRSALIRLQARRQRLENHSSADEE